MTVHSIYNDAYLYNVSFKLNIDCSNGDIFAYVQCDVGGLNLNTSVNIHCPSSGEIFKVLYTIKNMNEKPIRSKLTSSRGFFYHPTYIYIAGASTIFI